MAIKQLVYLFTLIILIALPFVLPKKHLWPFLKNTRYLLPAILFTGAIFVLWSSRFAGLHIWDFHGEFISGIFLYNLPIEEWIFFFAIPFISVYIYERIKSSFAHINKPNVSLAISLFLLVLFIGMTWYFRQKLYPFFTFFLLSVYFGYIIFRNRFKLYLTMFYLTFLTVLIPYLALRLYLTALPVITFNGGHITGITIFSVPVEDTGYLFLLLIMNVTIYEYLRERRYY